MEQLNKKRSLFSIFLPAIIFLTLLIAFIYNGARINNLEEQRQISPISNRYSMGNQDIKIINSQTVYVPIYSHINRSSGTPQLLEATLSIRNSDPKNSITLLSARYYDTEGQELQNYYKEPKVLKPLQSTEILVEKTDTRGGSGANFIIEWVADIPVYEPVIEAIMVSNSNNSISFKSTGRPLSVRKK